MATAVGKELGRDVQSVRFYTGMPHEVHNRKQNRFWRAKLAGMGRTPPGDIQIKVHTKPLRYREEQVKLHGGGGYLKHFVAREKGIDVRIALDIIRSFLQKEFEAAIIFSQDQDLSEAVVELKSLSAAVKRPVSTCSAFPQKLREERGIDGCEWFAMSEEFYNSCLDPNNYGHLPNLRG